MAQIHPHEAQVHQMDETPNIKVQPQARQAIT